VIQVLNSVAEQPDVGPIEAGARGFGQGLTFGFSDEMIAGASAAVKKLFSDKDFSELYGLEVGRQRARDVSAEAQQPGAFVGGEIAGALGTLAIPAGQVIRGAGAAGRGIKAAAGAVEKASKFLGPGKQAVAAQKLEKVTQAAKALPQVGKGFSRGLAGVTKGAGAGGVTAAGKSEAEFGTPEFSQDVVETTIGSGGLQAAINLAGPALRGTGKLVVKNAPKVARAGVIASKGFVAASLGEKALKNMASTVQAKAPELAAKIGRIADKAKRGGEATGDFINILAEAFEKQGGAGLISAHNTFLQDPRYREFLKEK
jgi:hypothetical protein